MEGSLELMWKDLFGGRQIWAWLITLNPLPGVMWGMEGVCSFGLTLGILGVFKLFSLIYFLLPMIDGSQTIRCFNMSIWKIFFIYHFLLKFLVNLLKWKTCVTPSKIQSLGRTHICGAISGAVGCFMLPKHIE